MKRFRRITLAMLALSILAASLAFNSGAAHAQTRAALVPQHALTTLEAKVAAMPADSGWTGFYYAGGWGWGVCLSHDATQSLGDWSDFWRAWIWNGILQKIGFWPGMIAFGIIEGNLWYMKWVADRGSGVCLDFPWGSPALMWIRSQ